METKKEEKPPLKVGDKLLIALKESDSVAICKAHVLSVRETDFVYERFYTNGSSAGRCTGYLQQEGNAWCRGWTGKAARALRAEIDKLAHSRKQAEMARERKYEDDRIKSLQSAARIVARAKLPRELRVAAFQACMGGVGPFFLR
jgi:hypothetical protein